MNSIDDLLKNVKNSKFVLVVINLNFCLNFLSQKLTKMVYNTIVGLAIKNINKKTISKF